VTSVVSLFNSPAADVTLDRVRELVGQNLPESLTLEYKEAYSSGVITSVAAMGNSYGGLILVGVTDQQQANRLVGVPEETVVQIVNACHDKLEPPWEPEIIPVALDGGGQSYVLVVRVDHSRAPRPLLIDGHAPIRLQGRNAKADRDRLAQLFSEPSASPRATARLVTAPELPTNQDGSPSADFVLRSGMVLSIGEAASWRPLSDRGIDLLAAALNTSPLNQALLGWCGKLNIGGFNPFHRSGFNRARHARLVWQAATDREPRYPIEVISVVDLPTPYGALATSLSFSIDVTLRVRAFLATLGVPAENWRLAMPDLYKLLDAVCLPLSPATKWPRRWLISPGSIASSCRSRATCTSRQGPRLASCCTRKALRLSRALARRTAPMCWQTLASILRTPLNGTHKWMTGCSRLPWTLACGEWRTCWLPTISRNHPDLLVPPSQPATFWPLA
jgi:Schlafen, AlbA_2